MTTEDYRNKSKLAILFSFFKPHKKLFILDMCCAFIMAVIDLAYPFVSRIAMNKWLPEKAYRAFFTVMFIIVIAYILRAILYYIVTVYGHRFGVLVEVDIRLALFEHIQKLPFSFFDKNRTGQLMSRVTSDLFEIVELSHHGPEDVLISCVTLVGALIFMAFIEWRLALMLAIIIPIFIFFLLKLKKWRERVSLAVKIAAGKINNEIESSISGIRTGKAFANETIEYKKFSHATDEYKDHKKEYYKCMAYQICGMDLCCSLISVAVMIFGGFLIMKDNMNYVDLITFCLYITTFITPIRKLVNLSETYANGMAGLQRFIEIMSIEPEIRDKENARDLKVSEGRIDIENISFSYDEGRETLKGIDLKIKAGETLAVVGSSGGGKTTLCQLIPRFYDVDSGAIKIDGTDIRDVTQKSLHESIGIVQQDVFLFADSILENIRYGRPNATVDEVVEAAKKAEIYDDITNMPDGFNTFVGERGTLLSGGQKQRVAIARIFLKNPPILILDEATSALDSITESKIQSAFDSLAVGRTTLIIAHRLSTIKNADRIVAIENGCIVEEGTSEELVEKGGIYKNLLSVQQV